MIIDFRRALADFESTSHEVISLIKTRYPNEHVATMRFYGALDDLVNSSRIAFSKSIALEPWIQQFHSVGLSIGGTYTLREIAKELEEQRVFLEDWKRLGLEAEYNSLTKELNTAFKSYILFCRSFQDCLYHAMLLLSENPPPTNVNMTRAFSGRNPKPGSVFEREFLVKGEYVEWFWWLNDIRNRVKAGNPIGTIGPPGDIGVTFSFFDETGIVSVTTERKDRVLRSDLVKGLNISRNLCLRLCELGRT
ncbi:MAG: hypothetical protein AAGF27_06945 [Pseudomonadota bacterium]